MLLWIEVVGTQRLIRHSIDHQLESWISLDRCHDFFLKRCWSMVDSVRGFSLVNTDVSKGSSVRRLLADFKFVNCTKLIPAGAGIGSKQWNHKASGEQNIKGLLRLSGHRDKR